MALMQVAPLLDGREMTGAGGGSLEVVSPATGGELGMEGLRAFCKRKSAVINADETAPLGWNLG